MLRLELLGIFLLVQLTHSIDVDELVENVEDKTKEEMASDEPENLRKIIAGGLNRETSDEKFREYFSQFGSITDGAVVRDLETQSSRGFGYVTFAKVSGADACIARKKAGGHELDGKILEVRRYTPNADLYINRDQPQTHRIFLGGLKEGITKENVKEYFEANFACKVESLDLAETTEGGERKLRGFGFLTLDDMDAVDKVLIIRYHEIAGIQVDAILSKEGGGTRGRGGHSGTRGRGGHSDARGRGGHRGGYGGGEYGRETGYGRGYGGR